MTIIDQSSMPYMKSLASCLNRMVTEGYSNDFHVNEQGLLSVTQGMQYKPEEISIVNFYRFEGQSDPADNAILYIIETSDGVKGTILDAYGAYHDSRISAFLQEVASFRKKSAKKEL